MVPAVDPRLDPACLHSYLAEGQLRHPVHHYHAARRSRRVSVSEGELKRLRELRPPPSQVRSAARSTVRRRSRPRRTRPLRQGMSRSHARRAHSA